MTTLPTLWTNHAINPFVNWIVWIVFVIDFGYRLQLAEQKWLFIKKNPFLVIAIIPFDQFFQVARLVRVIYLFRMKTVAKYYIQPVIEQLSYFSKMVILIIIMGYLALQAFVLWKLEGAIISYEEALGFSIKQLLFFGQRLVEVEYAISLFLLVLTTIVGVFLHGLALQWLFHKIEGWYQRYRKKQVKQTENKDKSF
ncbi:potassium voltage-gated channel subfamily KQT [Halalkalibacter wakoensis JCM 9140]|uniref:Potassium voltage-gated channel subfamily KQT n=1 Tax=Halalkalibacter wakoensis JCM 9140 TaxID=1236970 RepID=W4Q923_9BACI|nr:hypothetical protein [Halalkalibacter wakoensis]GAE28457.1 potassium voltage-gated channel subfamily KQT [Halalkalibacter wakoensis JCM 9140]